MRDRGHRDRDEGVGAVLLVGIDWADKEHAYCVMDEAGTVLATGVVRHSPEGFAQLQARRDGRIVPGAVVKPRVPSGRRRDAGHVHQVFDGDGHAGQHACRTPAADAGVNPVRVAESLLPQNGGERVQCPARRTDAIEMRLDHRASGDLAGRHEPGDLAG